MYALEEGGVPRLDISFHGSFRWGKVVVKFDGKEVVSFSTSEIKQGKVVMLPDGSRLKLRWVINPLAVFGVQNVLECLRNDRILPGSPTHPKCLENQARSTIRLISIILGVCGAGIFLVGFFISFWLVIAGALLLWAIYGIVKLSKFAVWVGVLMMAVLFIILQVYNSTFTMEYSKSTKIFPWFFMIYPLVIGISGGSKAVDYLRKKENEKNVSNEEAVVKAEGYCEECGHKISKRDKFCESCGVKVR